MPFFVIYIMSKRNQVLFTKPEDPKFLKLIKQQIGYKDGPSIDAKVRNDNWYIYKLGLGEGIMFAY